MKIWVPVIKFKPVELGKSKSAGHAYQLHTPSRVEPKNRSKKIYISSAAVVVCLLVVFLIWHNLNSANYGQVAVISPETTSSTKLPEFTALSTNYYTLDYSERYSQEPTDINPAGVLDYKVLAYQPAGQASPNKIEVSIKAAPDGGITLDSAYDYYAKHPANYKLSNQLTRGEIIDIARSKNGSPEAAGLWLHSGYILIVKVSTPDTRLNIDSELKSLLSSVQWIQ